MSPSSLLASTIDTDGVAVVTGGASGFGLETATRLLRAGMSVVILDVSVEELEAANQKLSTLAPDGVGVLAQRCNVAVMDDCVAASAAVSAAFPKKMVSFLFNNAGIQGPGRAGGIIADPSPETMAAWQAIFNVNVFGAVNILKAFVPGMIGAGPLPSGKPSYVVTTSSVVGLLNHVIGPYTVSKMACTAVCENLSLELQQMGEVAAHISSHSLHPTVAATNFLTERSDDGTKGAGDTAKLGIQAVGGFTANDIIDGLFSGLSAGKYYIVVDHPDDTPSGLQIQARADDMISGARPRRPEQLASLKALVSGAFPSLKRPILTETYLSHACSCQKH